ncbi:MAG TPA: hypothetical protein VFK97_02170 [Candidatus Saccharimonadales bacterium]|nr:hypothetical protein [Candidatus Saccharimonadales bacterium]
MGEGDDKLIIIVRWPDALPCVPPIDRQLAEAEIAREASLAYGRLESRFSEHYTDTEPLIYTVTVVLKKNKGELEIIVLSTRHVDQDILTEWVHSLLVAPLMRRLLPSRDELFHLEAIRAQEVAELLEVEADCLDNSELEAMHEVLQEGTEGTKDLKSVFALLPSSDPNEPDETTHENVWSLRHVA